MTRDDERNPEGQEIQLIRNQDTGGKLDISEDAIATSPDGYTVPPGEIFS